MVATSLCGRCHWGTGKNHRCQHVKWGRKAGVILHFSKCNYYEAKP